MKRTAMILMVALALVFARGAIAQETVEENELPAGGLVVGDHGAGSFNEVVGDLLVPVSGDEEQLILVNPRGSLLSGPEEELNLGFAYRRHLTDPGVILGGNIFYDSRWTRHNNHFNQLGVGVEALSRCVDFRFNYYLPEKGHKIIREWEEVTVDVQSRRNRGRPYRASDGSLQQPIITTETTTTTITRFTEFEEGLEGYDAEIGAALNFMPEWLDMSIFGGYYNFWSESGVRFDGLRGRLEIRPVKALTIDAEVYSNDELNGSDYLVGARLNFPFDFWNIRRDRNVFEGTRDTFRVGRRSLEDRMSEMIIRDFRVRVTTQQSSTVVTSSASTKVTKKDVEKEPPEDDDDDPPQGQIG